MKYNVQIAVDVTHYTDVIIEADSTDDALDKVEADINRYFLEADATSWEADWRTAEDLRVVDAIEEGE